MIIRDYLVPEQAASTRLIASPRMVERICPTCIALATFGELKSTMMVRGWRNGFVEEMFPLRSFFQQSRRRPLSLRGSSGNLLLRFRPVQRRADVELCQNVRCQLARVHLSLLGERNQRVALVIAELRIGARAHLHRVQIGIRQDLRDGLAELLLEFFVQHR